MNDTPRSIELQNERDYISWLKRQGISRAEHSRRVSALIKSHPIPLQLELKALKERLKRKHNR